MKRALAVVGTLGLGVLLLAAPAGAAPAAAGGGVRAGETSGAPDPTRVRCDEGRWPLTVEGEPHNFNPGDPAGYRLWHDRNGWHLRTTTPGDGDHVFRGVIRSADDIRVVAEFHNEPADFVRAEDHTIVFEFHTHDGVDGIDFRVGCTDHVSFNLQANGVQVPAERIWLGKVGRAPGNPFTVFRAR